MAWTRTGIRTMSETIKRPPLDPYSYRHRINGHCPKCGVGTEVLPKVCNDGVEYMEYLEWRCTVCEGVVMTTRTKDYEEGA